MIHTTSFIIWELSLQLLVSRKGAADNNVSIWKDLQIPGQPKKVSFFVKRDRIKQIRFLGRYLVM